MESVTVPHKSSYVAHMQSVSHCNEQLFQMFRAGFQTSVIHAAVQYMFLHNSYMIILLRIAFSKFLILK